MFTGSSLFARYLRQLAFGLVASFAAVHAAYAADPLKVCFVYSNPIGDSGWTYQHDLGRKAMEQALGSKVTTKYVENVAANDAERVIRNLAREGCKLVFTASFDFMNPTLKVATQFPGVVFMNAGGYKTAKNVGNYIGRFYEGRYLSGWIAGKMSKTGIAGYVGSFPIPEIVRDINAFTLGLRSANPQAQVKIVWVNSWYDPGKEREAAGALIAQGADVLTYATASSAIVSTAADKGVYSIGYFSDMAKYGPKTNLTSLVEDWGSFYTLVAEQVISGTWKPSSTWGGMKDGMVKMAPLNAVVPADVKAGFAHIENEIIDGKLHVFAGPIVDQDGKTRVASGKDMSDKEINEMNYFVKGVEGRLPQ